MYWTFGVSVFLTFMLSYPDTDYVIHGIHGPIAFSTSMGLVPFIVAIFILGFFMSLGKAAVYKHIPVYYPGHVGAVGGLVGMIGGLGGFVLPIAFGVVLDLTGIWTSCFMLLFALVAVAFVWMHVSIGMMERAAEPAALAACRRCPRCSRSMRPCMRVPWARPSKTGAPRMRSSGRRRGGASRAAISGFRCRPCCSRSRCGWCGAWWWPSCR